MDIDNLLQKYNFINSILNCENKSLTIMKSHLMLKCKEMAKEERLELDTGPQCCKWCLNAWKPGQYSAELQPQKHPKGRVRSLLKKDISLLNKFQQKLVQRIKRKSSGNVLILKCHICHKNTNVQLKKFIAGSELHKVNIKKIDEPIKKKKKKKKDLYAGLNPAVLQNYIKSVENQPSTSKSVKYSGKKHKPDKKVTLQKQIRIHQELMYAPQLKKKPQQKSLLSTFLENM